MSEIRPDNIPDRLPMIPYDSHPMYSAPSGEIRPVDRLFALVRVVQMATYVVVVRFWQLMRVSGRALASESKISRKLERDGLFVHRLPKIDRATILEVTQPYFGQLAVRRDSIPRGSRSYGDNQLDLRPEDANELFGILEDKLSACGILPAIRRHLGCRAKLRTVTAQINDEWDTYWRAHFQERGLDPPPTAFFHVDNTYGVMKVIFYVSTVFADNGPFSYVLGTHSIRVGRLESLVLRATDIWLDTFPQERHLFIALPRFMRRKAKFGDDILVNNEWGRWLLKREAMVTSSEGDILAFDVKGIHRGGMVIKGERRILQIMIR